MRKILMAFCFLPFSMSYAASCTLSFSVAGFNTVYQSVGYSFIPLSSVNPEENGGVQYSVKTSKGFISSAITPWKNTTTVLVDDKKNCSSIYKTAVVNISISYADLVSSSTDNIKATTNTYCLLGLITPSSGSQTVSLPTFPNALYWQPCA